MNRVDSSATDGTLQAAVLAAGWASVRLSEAAPLRKTPPAFPGVELAGHFFKHADEQTIVALQAIAQAVERQGLDPRELAGWGIVAAPRYIGRLTGTDVLHKFPRRGTAAVAPHIVAQCSLHSVSGAASIALGMHGPNVGVGGGAWAIGDGIVAALTLFDAAQVPGVWLLLTQFDQEPVPNEQGQPLNDPLCHGVALALMPGASGESQIVLRPGAAAATANLPEPTVAEIASLIDASQRGLPARWGCRLPWGARVELQLAARQARLAA